MSRDEMRTAEFIRQLAQGADIGRRPYRALLPRLLAAALLGSLLSAAVVVLVFGARKDFAAYALTGIFGFKLLSMALLAWAGLMLVRAAGIPGSPLRPLVLLSPALLLLVAGALLDDSGLPITGARGASAPMCVLAIVLASLPALVLMLAVLRSAAPTRPSLAGAMAGLLAGALGAMGYALACINDGAGFVAVWYSGAVLLAAGLGALLGRRALTW